MALVLLEVVDIMILEISVLAVEVDKDVCTLAEDVIIEVVTTLVSGPLVTTELLA